MWIYSCKVKMYLLPAGQKELGRLLLPCLFKKEQMLELRQEEEALQDAQSELEDVRTYTADLTNESDRVALIEKFIKRLQEALIF